MLSLVSASILFFSLLDNAILLYIKNYRYSAVVVIGWSIPVHHFIPIVIADVRTLDAMCVQITTWYRTKISGVSGMLIIT